MLIYAYLGKQLTCGATTAWGLTYFSGSQGSKWTKHFGTTKVAQILTGVHRQLEKRSP